MDKYDSEGPQIDPHEEADKPFIWVVPNKDGTNQCSLQCYKQPYYLAFRKDGNEAGLFEGDTSDETDYRIFKFLDIDIATAN